MSSALPRAIEAERAILGTIIRWPETIRRVDLPPSDFYSTNLAAVFRHMLALDGSDHPIDPVTLNGRGVNLETVTELAQAVGFEENIQHYVRQVRDAAARRRILRAAEDLQRRARGDEPVEDLISGGVAAFQDCYTGGSQFRHISEFANLWWERVKARREDPDRTPSLGVTTGISKLNETLTYSGLARGHLSVVGAGSSEGKSALLDNGFALPAALGGQKVCLCSFEDSGLSVFVRGLSNQTGIQNRQLQQEIVSVVEWNDAVGATRTLVDLDIWVLDVVPAGVDAMIAQIRRHLAEHPADLLGIDYLQFIAAGVNAENETSASKYVITQIGKMARELSNTATVLLAQYRKREKPGGTRPTDEDLLGAGALHHFSHAIIHIWCPKKAVGLGCKTLIVSKNKNGPVGDVIAGWRGKTVTFCDPAPDDERQFRIAIGAKEAA